MSHHRMSPPRGRAGFTVATGVVSTAMLAAFASASPVHAQGLAKQDSAASLPGVTVTATRTPSRILTTPLAVTKVSESTLRGISGFGLDEALKMVPGVIARSRYGTSDIALMIRGYGARGAGDRSNSGTSRGVRVLVDGFPETEPDGRTPFDQIDLAAASAIEVIRSNASSIWGNGAGGVVNVLTMPTSHETSLAFQPVFGGFGLRRYAVRGSTDLGGATAWGDFTNSNFDGWRAHSSARRALLNGGVSGTVGDQTRLGLYVTAASTLMHVPGALTQAQFDADPTQANAQAVTRNDHRYNRSGRLGVTVDHIIDSTTSISSMLFVNPKYQQRSERNTFRDFNRYYFGGNVFVRKDVTIGGTRSRVSLGMDEAYQDGAIEFYNLAANGQRGPTLTDNKGEGANNFGIVLQDELTVNDRLSMLIGARYDAVAYYFRSFMPAPPVRTDSRVYDRVTPKVGINWMFDATHSVYANVGGGIEVPAQNESDPTPGAPPHLLNPLLEAILSTTYELGFKADGAVLGNGAATFGYDIALYDTEVKNDAIPYNSGRYYLTAAKVRRSGLEIGASTMTRSGVYANAAVTLMRNRYLNYVVDSAVIFPTDPTKVGQFADYSGHKVIGLPAVMANLTVGTEVPGLRRFRVEAALEHSGEYFADDANAVRVPAFTITNLTLKLNDPIATASGWGLRGFVTVQNVANLKYVGSAYLNPDLVGGAPAAFEPGMPRTIIVSLSAGRLR